MDSNEFESNMAWLKKVYNCALYAEERLGPRDDVDKLFETCQANEREHRNGVLVGPPKRRTFTIERAAHYFLVKALYEMRDSALVNVKDIAELRLDCVQAALLMARKSFREEFEKVLVHQFPEAVNLDVALNRIESLDYIELLGES